jgi:hypothetical protein
VRDKVHPFFRHAIHASQVTSIRHGETEIIDRSASLLGREFGIHKITLARIYIRKNQNQIPHRVGVWFIRLRQDTLQPAAEGNGEATAP